MVILVDSLLLRGDSLIIDVSVFLIDTFKIYLLNLKRIIDPFVFSHMHDGECPTFLDLLCHNEFESLN